MFACFRLLIISYETAKLNVEQLMRCEYGLIVCDEAHRLKNPKTALYRALMPLSSKMRIMVTGTPIQNDLDEASYAHRNLSLSFR